MRSRRIYTEKDLHSETTLELEPGPSHHIAKVLRMKEGDPLSLFNGRGGEYFATITVVSKKTVQVTTQQHRRDEVESPLQIELGIAISRGDRMDWVIQKATELGVSQITPLTTQRTEVKLKGDRAGKKHQHWLQIIISACEQCGRNRLPQLQTLATVDSWLPSVMADRKFVLHHRDTNAQPPGTTPGSAAILIGPEGGLSTEEISAAHKQGFEALTLGPRILRTETAPLAALAILQAKWGDMPLDA